MKRPVILVLTLAGVLTSMTGCGKKEAAISQSTLAVFAPLPDAAPPTAGAAAERVALGRMLFYDERLSKNQKISCNSCHDLAKYGVDGETTSEGHKGQRGDRNSPTVYNAAAQFVQFWDGRAANVEEQAKGPVLNPIEMAMTSDKAVVATLKSMPEYAAAFRRAYPGSKDPVTYDNAADAIGAFERGLVTPARWDKFLKGDSTALTADEKAGLVAFTDAGCQSCHSGALMGGNLYQRIGLMKTYPDASDPGRFKVTKNEADRLMFKTPTLRNIEKTGPYFHNGKVVSLEQAVSQMGDYQLGKQLDQAQVNSIVTFLKALTGEVPADYVKKPALPASTPQTPKPSEV